MLGVSETLRNCRIRARGPVYDFDASLFSYVMVAVNPTTGQFSGSMMSSSSLRSLMVARGSVMRGASFIANCVKPYESFPTNSFIRLSSRSASASLSASSPVATFTIASTARIAMESAKSSVPTISSSG